jgi:hypothetical protein
MFRWATQVARMGQSEMLIAFWLENLMERLHLQDSGLDQQQQQYGIRQFLACSGFVAIGQPIFPLVDLSVSGRVILK